MECETAAQELGLSDTTVVDDGQNGVSYDPPYCYFEGGSLKFNFLGTNTGSCTTSDNCLCVNTKRDEISIMSTPKGILVSPSYPQNYPNNADCIYIITQPTYTFFKLNFHSMDIDEYTQGNSSSQCSEDYVEIRDGQSETAPLLKQLCGNNSYEGIKNKLFMRWVVNSWPWLAHLANKSAIPDSSLMIVLPGKDFRSSTMPLIFSLNVEEHSQTQVDFWLPHHTQIITKGLKTVSILSHNPMDRLSTSPSTP